VERALDLFRSFSSESSLATRVSRASDVWQKLAIAWQNLAIVWQKFAIVWQISAIIAGSKFLGLCDRFRFEKWAVEAKPDP